MLVMLHRKRKGNGLVMLGELGIGVIQHHPVRILDRPGFLLGFQNVTGGSKTQNPLDVADGMDPVVQFIPGDGIADSADQADQHHHDHHLGPLAGRWLTRGAGHGHQCDPAR